MTSKPKGFENPETKRKAEQASHKTQLEKYGGAEGYSAEMRRRRSLVKKPGLASASAETIKRVANARWHKDEKETNSLPAKEEG